MRGVTIATSLALCLSLAAAEADPDPRGRHAARPRAFDFAADVNEVVGEITEEFSCDGLQYGYYADQFQDCKVFHICMPVKSDTGKILDTFQFSFFCPNQTRFSQDTRTCISDVYAYPCHDAHKLYYLNKAIGGQQKNKRKHLNTTFRKSVDVVSNSKNTGNIADLFKGKRRKDHTQLRIDKPHTPFIPQLTSPFTLNPTTSAPITGPSFVSTSHHNNFKNDAESSRQTETNRGQTIHKNSQSDSLSSNDVVVNNPVEPVIPGGAQLFSQTSTNVKKSHSKGTKVTSIKKAPSVTSSIRGSSSLSTQNTNASGNQGSSSSSTLHSNQSSSRGKIKPISTGINNSRGSAGSFGNNNNNIQSKTIVNNVSSGINTFSTISASNTFGQESSKSNFGSSKNTDTSTTEGVSSQGSSNSGLNTVRGSSVSANRGSVRGSSSFDTSNVSNTLKQASHNTARGSTVSGDLKSDGGSSNTLSGGNINTVRGSSVTGNQAAVRGSSNINTSRGSSSLNQAGATVSNTGFSSTTSRNSQQFKNSGIGLSSSSSLGTTGTSNSARFGSNTARGSSVTGTQPAVRGSSNINTSRGSSSFSSGSATLSNTGFSSTNSLNSNSKTNKNSGIGLSSSSSGTTGTSNSATFGSNTARGSSTAGNQAAVRGSSNINTSRGSSSLNRGSTTLSNTGSTSTSAANINTSRGSSNLNRGSTTLSNTGSSSTSSANSNNFRNSGIKLSSSSFGTTGRSNSAIFGSNDEKSTESSFVSGNIKSNSPLPSPISIPGAQLVSISKRPTHSHTVSFKQNTVAKNINHSANSQSHSQATVNTKSPFKTITDASAIVGKPAAPSIGRGTTTVLGRKDKDITQNKFSSESVALLNGAKLTQNNAFNPQLASFLENHANSLIQQQLNAAKTKSSTSSGANQSNNIQTSAVHSSISSHRGSLSPGSSIPGFSSGVHRVNGHLESGAISSTGHTSTFGTTGRTSTFGTTLPLPITTRAPFVTRPIHSTNVPHTSSFASTTENSIRQTTSSLHSHSSSINTSNNVKQGSFSNTKKSTGIPFPGRSSSSQTSSLNIGQNSLNSNNKIFTGSSIVNENQSSSNILSGSGASEQNRGNLNSGRRGNTVTQINASGAQSQRRGSNISGVSGSSTFKQNQGNLNAGRRGNTVSQINVSGPQSQTRGSNLSGLSGSGASEQNQNNINSGRRGNTVSQINTSGAQSQTRGSNLSGVSGSGASEQNRGNINSGRRGNTVSQINTSGAQSQTRGSNLSGVSGSTTTSTRRTTSRGSKRFKLPTGIKFPGKSNSHSTSHSDISTNSNTNSLRVKTRGGSNSQISHSNSHTTVTNGVSSHSKHGTETNSKINANLPRPPSIPGATLLAVTRRPVIKQGGISSQSESKVAHIHNVSHDVQKQSSSTSTTGRVTSNLTGTASHSTTSKHKTSSNSNKQNSPNSRLSSNFPRPPSISGATLIGVTRRPVIKQGGISSQSESKIAHNQGTIDKVSHNVQKQSSSTSTTGRVNSQLTGSAGHTTTSKHKTSSNFDNQNSSNSKLAGRLPRPPSIPGATLIGSTRRPVNPPSIPGATLISSTRRPVKSKSSTNQAGFNVQKQSSSTSTTGRVNSQLTGTAGHTTASKHKTSSNFDNQNSSNSKLAGRLRPPSIPGATLIGSTRRPVNPPSIPGATLISSTRRPVKSKSSTNQAGFKLRTNSQTQKLNTEQRVVSTILGEKSKSGAINIPSSINIPGAKLVSVRKRPINTTNVSQTSNINVHNSFTTANAESIIGRPAVSLNGANIASSNINQNNAFNAQLGNFLQNHANSLIQKHLNAGANKNTQTSSVSNNNQTTNSLLSSVVNNSINQASRSRTGNSQEKESSSQASSVSSGSISQVQNEHVSFTANKAQSAINNSNQNTNLRKTSIVGTTRTPSRRRGSSRGRGNSNTASRVNQITNQVNTQRTINNTPTVVATHSNSVVSTSESVLTNTPRRTTSRGRGSAKFTPTPFLLQSNFAGLSLTNVDTTGNSRVLNRQQSSHSSRAQSNSRNVNSRTNNAFSHNSKSDSQATLNVKKQDHQTISKSNPTPVSPISFTSTNRRQSSQSNLRSVNTNQRSNIVNQGKIAEFSDFESELTLSPIDDAITSITEAPLLRSTVSRKRSRGRAISNISRKVASNSLSLGNNVRNSPIITQVTTTPNPNIRHSSSLPETTSFVSTRRTTQSRTSQRPTRPSLFTSSVGTESSKTSNDKSSNSRLRSQIKTTNSNNQRSTSSISSGNISINRSASSSAFTAPKLPKGHNFKLPTNFKFPGATLIAFKTTPVKKAKESSTFPTSTPSNVFKTITNVESSIGKSAVPIISSNVVKKDKTVTNNNNNDRKVIRKKIRINGRPGSRKNDSKEIISTAHENSFESTQSLGLYGANENSQDSSSITYGVDSKSVTQSSISTAYGGNSNSGSSRRLSSVRRKTYGSDNSAGNNSDDNNSRILTSSRKNSYGSDSSDPSKIVTSTRRRTYGSDTASESSTLTDNNSRILSSVRRKSYGTGTSSDSSKNSQQASSTSSSSFSTQTYGSESTSSSSQNSYGSDTSSESSFSSQNTYGNSRSGSSSFSQRSSAGSFSSQRSQESESTSKSKISGNNHFRNVQPQIAIVTEIIPTTPASARQGTRRRVTSRRRLGNKINAEPKVIGQNSVNSKTTSTSTTRGNTNTSRRKVLKKVTKLTKTDVANDQSVPQVSEIFTPPPPISGTTASSSKDIVSSNSLSIPGLPPGLKLRVVGTSVKSSSSTSSSSSSSFKTQNTNSASTGSRGTKTTKNNLTDLEIEALSALAKINTGFSVPVRGRSLRRTRQRQNSKVTSIS